MALLLTDALFSPKYIPWYFLQKYYSRDFIKTCCGMYTPLSDDRQRIVQKVHPAHANGHCGRRRNCNPNYNCGMW